MKGGGDSLNHASLKVPKTTATASTVKPVKDRLYSWSIFLQPYPGFWWHGCLEFGVLFGGVAMNDNIPIIVLRDFDDLCREVRLCSCRNGE